MARKPRIDPAPTTPDPIEIAMEAEAGDPSPDSPARALLVDQRRLILWDIADRRAGVALKALMGLAGLVVALALGAMAWDAHNENGLVIQAFSVPPDLAARGITGEVVASKLLDQLTTMQNATISARAASTYANNWTTDIKVEIPETGVSIGELRRMLVQWLGHQTVISGEVYRTPTGLSVAARVGAIPARPQTGAEAELDSLLQTAAEKVFEDTQPYRYAVYLRNPGVERLEESTALFARLAASGVPEDRPWAIMGLARTAKDGPARIEMLDQVIHLNPNLAIVWDNRAGTQRGIGRHEQALAGFTRVLAVLDRRDRGGVSEPARDAQRFSARADVATLTGDYGAALAAYRQAANAETEVNGIRFTAPFNQAAMLARIHDVAGARSLIPAGQDDVAILKSSRNGVATLPNAAIYRAEESWPALYQQLSDTGGAWPAYITRRGQSATANDGPTLFWPGMAEALAHMGRMDEAKALIGRTPLDCYPCVRMRGVIAALDGDARIADHWFGEAVKMGPSLPFAETEWGEVLLARGDAAGAIVQLTAANRKSPRFADPLELWGEALLKQGDAKGAVAKFAAAEKYAPKWGRLHRQWGEALTKLGKPAEARTQFALASQLTPAPAPGAR